MIRTKQKDVSHTGPGREQLREVWSKSRAAPDYPTSEMENVK